MQRDGIDDTLRHHGRVIAFHWSYWSGMWQQTAHRNNSSYQDSWFEHVGEHDHLNNVVTLGVVRNDPASHIAAQVTRRLLTERADIQEQVIADTVTTMFEQLNDDADKLLQTPATTLCAIEHAEHTGKYGFSEHHRQLCTSITALWPTAGGQHITLCHIPGVAYSSVAGHLVMRAEPYDTMTTRQDLEDAVALYERDSNQFSGLSDYVDVARNLNRAPHL